MSDDSNNNIIRFPAREVQARRLVEKIAALPPDDQRAMETVVDILLTLDRMPPEHRRETLDILRRFTSMPVHIQAMFLEDVADEIVKDPDTPPA